MQVYTRIDFYGFFNTLMQKCIETFPAWRLEKRSEPNWYNTI